MNVSIQPISIGFVLAILVLIISIVLGLIGRLPWEVAGLLATLAIARLC